ncbi:sensor histidine kinase [Dyadobacter arcticus]|uniref:histidine kinase n=1 Tax=Dyadobacter arcticus TaxID=1078754 RepID=A0ABX0UL25_9BACT|nr:two-component regulator propeller domain-containing protein [Dyadobacter arcticus]NIJ53607.1 signal transduction histidine kinase/streptogramin lyase [Dyadobacter arcticus]
MIRYYLLLFAIFLKLSVSAQHTQPQYEHITVENGLPSARVTKCLQDKFGYIWIGTENGLVRYDGYDKKVYKLETGRQQNLTSLNIQELFEDSRGNIWIGTFYDGVFRYNRTTDNFTQIKHQVDQKADLATNDVHSIREDGAGNMYFYTYDHAKNIGYINHYNLAKNTFRKFGPNMAGQNQIPKFESFPRWFKDKKGQIWIASRNGLHLFDHKTSRFKGYLTQTDSTKQKVISHLYQSPSDPNTLYFSDLTYRNGFRGIVSFNTETGFHKTYSYEGLKQGGLGYIFDFFEDKQKRLWIGTNQGLSQLDETSGKLTHYSFESLFNGIKTSEVFAIAEDNTGLLWLSMANGILNFDPVTHQFSNINNLFKDEIDPERLYYFQFAFQDRSGSLWFKDRDGVHKLKKEFSLFNFYKKDNSDPTSYSGGYLYNAIRMQDGNYMLASIKGIHTWDSQTNKFHKIEFPGEVEKADIVLKMGLDKSGAIWGGLVKGNYNFKGLFQYNLQNKVFKFHKSDPDDPTSPSSDMISFLYADSKNDIWVGSFNKGVCRYNRKTETFTRFPFTFRETKKPDGELDDFTVTCIYEDRAGTIWIGTGNGGLNRFDPSTGKFKAYFDTKKGLRQISSIYEDKKGRFWVASDIYGLHLFDRKTGTSRLFDEKDGLLANGITGIAEDNAGRLWLSTNRGLSRFDPENKKFLSFTKEQGLPETRLNTATTRLDDGKILLGTFTGFITFDPAKITTNNSPPQVMIESVAYLEGQPGRNKSKETIRQLFGRNNLKFSHNQNRLRFNYVGLHYKNASRNQYMYQLEGYESDWVQAADHRSAVYTNLSAGKYTFKVKASNSDGVWTQQEARISFEILPPWWLTWWAFAIYALLFAALLRSYIYFRSRSLRRENQELEEKIGLRTLELSAANKELNQQRDQLTETVIELKSTQQQLIQSEKLASLGELTAGIAHEIQNPLNFVNNFSEVSVELADEMEYELKNGDKDEAIALAADIRQNLQKIMHHGQRAGGIVKSMLQHSRKNSGEKEPVNINELTDEYLKLSYHGLRAKDNTFNTKISTSFDDTLPLLVIIPQDIGRVLINLFNNAFYAIQQKQKSESTDYHPELQVSTAQNEKFVEIRVRDNGSGVPDAIKDKILQPFFTTKPTGEGTGLGLSLSYDILKGHGGKMDIDSKEGEYALFTISLPV